jgi:hypothetical protein
VSKERSAPSHFLSNFPWFVLGWFGFEFGNAGAEAGRSVARKISTQPIFYLLSLFLLLFLKIVKIRWVWFG